MTNKMIDGEKLLEWADTQVYDHQNVWFEWSRVVKMDKLKEKIQSLMSEAQTDIDVGQVDPSEWQVGDVLLTKCNKYHLILHSFCKNGDVDADDVRVNLRGQWPREELRNIDAERRVLQAEINAQKVQNCQLKEALSDIDNFCCNYIFNSFACDDYHTNKCGRKGFLDTFYNEFLGDLEEKFSWFRSLYLKKHQNQSQAIQEFDADPWCYDLEKATSIVDLMVEIDGVKTRFPDCNYRKIQNKWAYKQYLSKNNLDAYYSRWFEGSLNEFISNNFQVKHSPSLKIIAWMPIPEPKGAA